MEETVGPRRRTGRLLLWTRRIAAWVGVMLLGAAMAISSAPKVSELGNLALLRIENWTYLEQQLKVPGSGLEALHPDIGAAVKLLRAAGAPSYRLSPAIRQDEVRQDVFLTQRIEETAWPIPFDASAHFVIRKAEENLSCRQLAAEKGMAIDYCD